MEGLFGFPEAECQKDKIKVPEKMNGFEAATAIWGGYACHCSNCRKERGEKQKNLKKTLDLILKKSYNQRVDK